MILPIRKKGFKAGKARRHVVFLPDERLQKAGMVGHAVEDFRGRKTVALKLFEQMLIGHRHLFD
jgi:hypothetical protein